MGFSAYLVDLANRYKSNPFPWSELKAQGQGLLESDQYLLVLSGRWAEYTALMARFDLLVDDNALESLIDALGDSLNDHARVFLDADLRGIAEVALKDGMTLPGPLLRGLLSAAFTATNRAYWAHMNGVWRDGIRAGAVSLFTAEEDADSIYRIMGAVSILEKAGLLNSALPRGQSAIQGFGAAPAAAPIAGIILSVALMIAICFIFYEVWRTMERYQIANKCCFDANENPIDPTTEWCKKFCTEFAERGSPASDPFAKFNAQLGDAVKWVVILGGSAAALALTWPMLRRAFRSGKRAPA